MVKRTCKGVLGTQQGNIVRSTALRLTTVTTSYIAGPRVSNMARLAGLLRGSTLLVTLLRVSSTIILPTTAVYIPRNNVEELGRHDSLLEPAAIGHSNATYTDLRKRIGADHDRWDNLRKQGQQLLDLCEVDDSDLKEEYRTPWLKVNMPNRYGYVPIDPKEDEPFEGNEIGALKPLKAEGIDVDQTRDWITLNWVHQKQTQPEKPGPVYPPTGAQFRILINEAASVLVAAISMTSGKVKHLRLVEPKVPLRHWSDMAYLSWETLMYRENARPKLLPPDRIIRLNIYTAKTSQAVAHVLGGQIKEYPGQFIDARSEEGLMLMGTPHGKGVAYFLFQHKHLMDVWTVDRIQVWDSVGHVADSEGRGRWRSMAFYFRPVVRDFKSIDGKMVPSSGHYGEGNLTAEYGGQGHESSGAMERPSSPEKGPSREQQELEDVPPHSGETERVGSGVNQASGSEYQAGQGSSTSDQNKGKGKGTRFQNFKSIFKKTKSGSSNSLQ